MLKTETKFLASIMATANDPSPSLPLPLRIQYDGHAYVRRYKNKCMQHVLHETCQMFRIIKQKFWV